MEPRSICVFCGSRPGARTSYGAAAESLGRAIASRRLTLVYGGGSVGLMGILADAALAASGRVIGVIPEALATKELAHSGLSELRVVASMHERKALMADLADAFAALPGGFGTLEELLEIVTWAQLGIHAKPVALLNVDGFFDPLLAFLDHAVVEGYVSAWDRALILESHDAETLVLELMGHRPPVAPPVLTPEET